MAVLYSMAFLTGMVVLVLLGVFLWVSIWVQTENLNRLRLANIATLEAEDEEMSPAEAMEAWAQWQTREEMTEEYRDNFFSGTGE